MVFTKLHSDVQEIVGRYLLEIVRTERRGDKTALLVNMCTLGDDHVDPLLYAEGFDAAVVDAWARAFGEEDGTTEMVRLSHCPTFLKRVLPWVLPRRCAIHDVSAHKLLSAAVLSGDTRVVDAIVDVITDSLRTETNEEVNEDTLGLVTSDTVMSVDDSDETLAAHAHLLSRFADVPELRPFLSLIYLYGGSYKFQAIFHDKFRGMLYVLGTMCDDLHQPSLPDMDKMLTLSSSYNLGFAQRLLEDPRTRRHISQHGLDDALFYVCQRALSTDCDPEKRLCARKCIHLLVAHGADTGVFVRKALLDDT